MLGFVYVCGLALYVFGIDMLCCFGMRDAMLYVRCMLVCVRVRKQVLNLFLIRLRHKTQQ